MSYDLYFWREKLDAKIDIDHFFEELDDTMEFPGIVSLPLDTVKAAFRQEFPDVSDGGGTLEWEGGDSYSQVSFAFLDEHTVSQTSVFCGWSFAMDRLPRVAASLGYRVYDPQQT